MWPKVRIWLSCVTLLLLAVYSVFAVSVPKQPVVNSGRFPKAGYVSLDYIVTFEDVERLSPAMARATMLLRTGQFQQAAAAFRAVQQVSPSEALAYRGENETARFLNTLDLIIARDQQLVSAADAHPRSVSNAYRAALHYGLGDALMMKNYPTPIGEAPHNLGPEPKRQLIEVIRLRPNLLEAHLALAAYYEHGSQRQGTAARREYDVCLQLRPDLYQVRYLHAASWDRPGYVLNRAQLQAQGIQLSVDEQMMPERAIAECLHLVQDYPNYAPPYYRLGSDYAFPLRDFAKAKQYLSVYAKIGDPTLGWWQYATAEVQTIDREAAKNHS